jgi:hypothetical protein
LPVLGLDIGLGKQVCVDFAELRTRYFTVRGARPILVEDIEENELLDTANSGTVWPCVNLRILVDVPRISTNRRGPSKTAPSLQIAVP